MVDAFVSYSRQDARRVERLVALLESRGCSVWWDRLIEPSRDFERTIDEALTAASCVIIALTRNASTAEWACAETDMGRNQRKVIPVLLDDVTVPLALRTHQVADLRAWPGPGDGEADRLVDAVLGRRQPPRRSFVGREDLLDTLQSAFATSTQGRGGVVLISGEPGIGKTRSAEEFAQRAEDQGALVLWGRCYEQQGAPPYWPWVQVLRGYADASSDDELRLLLDGSAAAVVALVPEIGERLSIAPLQSGVAEQAQNRFQVFDAIARVFARASAAVPQILFIDDIHWADPSSLSLLEYLAKEARRHRLLIVCTYRDVEVTRGSPLLATLGELTRVAGVERIRLSGLTLDDTGELTRSLAGIELPPAVVLGVFQQTDGNPLFVSEVAKVIGEECRASSGALLAIDIPDGVREAIGRRLNRLSASCNELLRTASILGRDIDAKVVARTMGFELHEVLSELEAAVAAGIVQYSSTAPGRLRFTHALIRETLYDEVPTVERLRLHEKVARALIDLHGSNLDPVLSELVHHFSESAVLGDFETAVAYALRAAARDERVYAFEEATRHYGEALRLLKANDREADPRAARSLLRLGVLELAVGRRDRSNEALAEGIGLARQLGDPDLFAGFAVMLVRLTSYAAQNHAVPLLEEALELLPEHAVRRRAEVLGSLVFALRTRGDAGHVERVAGEAAALARAVDDAATSISTLRMVCLGLRGWAHTLPARLTYGAEMLAAVEQVDDPHEKVEGIYFHLLNVIESGDVRLVARLLDRYRQISADHHFARHEYQAALIGSLLSLLHGEWAGVEEAIEASLQQGQQLIGEDSKVAAEGVYGVQMFQLNRDLGRLRDIAPAVRYMVQDGQSRLWGPGLMLMCCEVDLTDEARRVLEELAEEDFAALPKDDLWVVCMAFCAETCAVLHDMERAARVYDLLLPYAGQTVHHPSAVCFGSATAYLGLLAHTLGRSAAARQHFEDAVSMNRAMGAWPALVRTQLWFGRALLTADDADEQARGRQLLSEAEQLAGRFQMVAVVADIDALLNQSPVELPDDLTSREADVLKLLALGRSNKDISKVLAISLSTVATHVRSILGKTGCANRTEAAAYAIRHGLTLE